MKDTFNQSSYLAGGWKYSSRKSYCRNWRKNGALKGIRRIYHSWTAKPFTTQWLGL